MKGALFNQGQGFCNTVIIMNVSEPNQFAVWKINLSHNTCHKVIT